MPRNLPPYVCEFIDRHGRLRRYFRYKGKKTPIPYRPGNAAFDALYRELLASKGLLKQEPEKVAQVYFVRCAGRIKIGFASDLKKRISAIQTSAPEPLEILHAIAGSKSDERALHKRFEHLRRTGEWFEAVPELLDFIAGLRQEAA